MLWIIVGGTLLAFFYLLTFSLCKISSQADRAIELNIQKLELENTVKIVKTSPENPTRNTTRKGTADLSLGLDLSN